jgi:hypothetical protein
MYDIPNCGDCGGDPVIYLIRLRKLTKIKLQYEQTLELLADDMLAVYCSKCERAIEIEIINQKAKEAKK